MSVHAASWKSLINEYRDGSGQAIPSTLKPALVEYFTTGKVEKQSFLYGMLINSITMVFQCKKTSLEASRMQTVWDFLTDHAPTTSWGSPEMVRTYMTNVLSIPSIQARYNDLLEARA